MKTLNDYMKEETRDRGGIAMNRKAMEKIYLSYRNDFLTIDSCAEYHEIDPETLRRIVMLYCNRDEKICDITEDYSDFESPSDIINFR